MSDTLVCTRVRRDETHLRHFSQFSFVFVLTLLHVQYRLPSIKFYVECLGQKKNFLGKNFLNESYGKNIGGSRHETESLATSRLQLIVVRSV